MPLEFALRPRIRLREGFAPPRRSRWRLPKVALPILAYWLVAGGITYELMHLHDAPSGIEPRATAALSPQPPEAAPQRTETVQPAAPRPAEPEPAPSAPLALAQNDPATSGATVEPDSELEPEPSRAVWPPPATRREPAVPAADTAAPSRHHPHERDALREETPELTPAHAAETPRISADLFPKDLGEPSEPSAPTERQAPEAPAVAHVTSRAGDSLPGCEFAAAAATEDVDLSRRNLTPDLSRAAIGGVLDSGAWLADCAVPSSTSIDVCVAVTSGRVLGATVILRPASAAGAACVKRRAAALMFPYSSHLDVARTHFGGYH